ncbi:hypothetical protein Rhe02_55860 [Rhizocola hellebori]|uniref:HTH gntR-type domain-containing protein n=1 Tax=Rhizocola hellebori TaxID=1392758 RepID=A0A8J3QCZ7_9ACTN|nr:GntR family transcriptional regulator [Rhizocola hellebori]GIH07519.1 hypothetical protein Rhe02_55860 [Rhizocola hellebori]
MYEGLASELLEHVQSLSPGDRLASEPALMQEFDAKRGTLREALKMLERQGFLRSVQGKGWYVTERNPVTWYASWPERGGETDLTPSDAWARGVREQGRTPTEDPIEVAVLIAEPRIATRLNLESGAYVVARRRLRYVDGVINNSNDTYYPKTLVEGTPISLPGDIVPGVYAVLEELGRGWVSARDQKVARAATSAEAVRFGITPGDPMMETLRTRYDAERQPVAVTVVVAPGDRTIDEYEVES